MDYNFIIDPKQTKHTVFCKYGRNLLKSFKRIYDGGVGNKDYTLNRKRKQFK